MAMKMQKQKQSLEERRAFFWVQKKKAREASVLWKVQFHSGIICETEVETLALAFLREYSSHDHFIPRILIPIEIGKNMEHFMSISQQTMVLTKNKNKKNRLNFTLFVIFKWQELVLSAQFQLCLQYLFCVSHVFKV